jgi:hypothetical protein
MCRGADLQVGESGDERVGQILLALLAGVSALAGRGMRGLKTERSRRSV